MLVYFLRLLPIVVNWRANKTVHNGQYVENIISHVTRKFPMSTLLVAANDNGDGPPSTDLGMRRRKVA